MIIRRTSLAENIVQFCRFLRQKNFTIGMEEEAITLQALQFIDYTDPSIFRLALKQRFAEVKHRLKNLICFLTITGNRSRKAVDAKIKDGSSKKQPPVSQPDNF